MGTGCLVNSYTDAVIADIENRFAHAENISVWGGSYLRRWCALRDEKNLPMPHIIVFGACEAAPDSKTYAALGPDDMMGVYAYGRQALPIYYEGPSIAVFAKDADSANEIAARLQDTYENGETIQLKKNVQDIGAIPLFVRIRKDGIEAAEHLGSNSRRAFPIDCYVVKITCSPSRMPRPLFPGWIDYDGVRRDRDAQCELLKLALWLDETLSPRKAKASLASYRYFVDPSFKQGGFDEAVIKMREKADSGERPDRASFEAAFQPIVMVCPDLFDRYGRCEPFSDTAKYVLSGCEEVEALKSKICANLGIPECFEFDVQIDEQPRERAALEHYIKRMSEDSTLTMADVNREYRDLHYSYERKTDCTRYPTQGIPFENVEEDQVRQDSGHDYDYAESDYEASGSPGILGSILTDAIGAAIGSAIGTRGVRKEIREQTRRMEAEAREARREEERIRNQEKRERAYQSQREWDAVKRANDERRRKGEPLLPLPPRFYW